MQQPRIKGAVSLPPEDAQLVQEILERERIGVRAENEPGEQPSKYEKDLDRVIGVFSPR